MAKVLYGVKSMYAKQADGSLADISRAYVKARGGAFGVKKAFVVKEVKWFRRYQLQDSIQYSCSISPNGRYLATTTSKEILVYKQTVNETYEIVPGAITLPAGYNSVIDGVSFLGDTPYVVVCAYIGTGGGGMGLDALIYRYENKFEYIRAVRFGSSSMLSCIPSVTYDGGRVLISDLSSVYIFRHTDGALTRTQVLSVGGGVAGTSISPDGEYIAISSVGNTKPIVYMRNGDLFNKSVAVDIDHAARIVYSCSFSYDNRFLAAQFSDESVYVYEKTPEGYAFVREMYNKDDYRKKHKALTFSPTNNTAVLYSGTQPYITVIDGFGENEVWFYPEKPSGVSYNFTGCFSCDGRFFAEGYLVTVYEV